MNDDFDSIFENKDKSDEITTEETETVEPIVDNEVIDEVEAEPSETVADVETESTKESNATVPIGALLDTRDKLKDEKRRADEAERRLAEYENSHNHKQPSYPDPYDDPEGYRAQITNDIENRFIAQKLNTSRVQSIEKHGQELTQTAINWATERANSDPAFEQAALANDTPVEWIIQQHKRHTELAEFETDRESFIRREAAKLGIGSTESSVNPTSTPNGVKNTAPRSLATVSSATKNTSNDIDSTASFNSIFDK